MIDNGNRCLFQVLFLNPHTYVKYHIHLEQTADLRTCIHQRGKFCYQSRYTNQCHYLPRRFFNRQQEHNSSEGEAVSRQSAEVGTTIFLLHFELTALNRLYKVILVQEIYVCANHQFICQVKAENWKRQNVINEWTIQMSLFLCGHARRIHHFATCVFINDDKKSLTKRHRNQENLRSEINVSAVTIFFVICKQNSREQHVWDLEKVSGAVANIFLSTGDQWRAYGQ